MSSDFKPEREIYLIFMDTNSYLGYNMFKEGFRHVFAIERQPLGWICHDPNTTDWQSFIVSTKWSDDVIGAYVDLYPDIEVLSLFIEPSGKLRWWRPFLSPCVGSLQYLIGVYWPLTLTPYQLYCKLKYNPPRNIKVEDYEYRRGST